jgi:hypothetical protein
MRTLAKAMVRRIPIVRDRFEERDAALAHGPDQIGVMTERTPMPATYAKTATYEDIFYCFRLLLGRNPNPEEWPGHSSRIGEELENVVSSYVTSREFAERGILKKTYQDHVQLAHFPGFSLFASIDDLAVGNHVLVGRSYDPRVATVLMRHIKPGMSVLDIGANIVYFTTLLKNSWRPVSFVPWDVECASYWEAR